MIKQHPTGDAVGKEFNTMKGIASAIATPPRKVPNRSKYHGASAGARKKKMEIKNQPLIYNILTPKGKNKMLGYGKEETGVQDDKDNEFGEN